MSRPIKFPRLSDLLTTGNLCCGVLSILLASQGQLTIACWLIFLAAIFDVFDGMAARAFGGGSPLGAQLDSLADMVSFGVAPGMLLYWYIHPMLSHQLLYEGRIITAAGSLDVMDEPTRTLLPIAVALIAVCSAWRLAKFNIDIRQTTGFLGLPTPANALFWASVPLMDNPSGFLDGLIGHGFQNPWVLFALADCGSLIPFVPVLLFVPLLCILMLSELPLPSLKFKHGGWKGNEVIFLLIGIGALLAVLYGILAVPLLLLIYLLSPLWGKLFPKTT